MSLAAFLPDPTNQGKDNQGRVEDEEKMSRKAYISGVLQGGYGSRFIRSSRSWKRGSSRRGS